MIESDRVTGLRYFRGHCCQVHLEISRHSIRWGSGGSILKWRKYKYSFPFAWNISFLRGSVTTFLIFRSHDGVGVAIWVRRETGTSCPRYPRPSRWGLCSQASHLFLLHARGIKGFFHAHSSWLWEGLQPLARYKRRNGGYRCISIGGKNGVLWSATSERNWILFQRIIKCLQRCGNRSVVTKNVAGV